VAPSPEPARDPGFQKLGVSAENTSAMEDFEGTLSAAQSGAEWAVAELWSELHPPLLRFLRGRHPGFAEDVESETWIRIADGLRRFEGTESDFRAWAFTIARNRLIDWCRRDRRQASTPVDLDALAVLPGPDDAAAAVEEELGLEASLALIRTLPPDQGEVILLRVLGGLDVARVARIVGKRPGTVRVLQHRGLRRLAEQLGTPIEVAAEHVAR
jgi:RNA polymerase sigma-70 factor (ECF subfamily)